MDSKICQKLVAILFDKWRLKVYVHYFKENGVIRHLLKMAYKKDYTTYKGLQGPLFIWLLIMRQQWKYTQIRIKLSGN